MYDWRIPPRFWNNAIEPWIRAIIDMKIPTILNALARIAFTITSRAIVEPNPAYIPNISLPKVFAIVVAEDWNVELVE